MKSEDKKIEAFHSWYQLQVIELTSKVLDWINGRNLRWPIVFSLFCFFSFWSEVVNYHYYKYFTKWVPMFAICVHIMAHLECLDKKFYDKFSYADYTAIGFIISIPGDALYTIDDNNMGLMPGLCMFLIMNIWYALSFFPCLYYHRKQRLTNVSSKWKRCVLLGIVAAHGISYLNAQLILSIADYEPTYLVYSYAGTQALMVSLQLIRRPYTTPQSYGYTTTGNILHILGNFFYYCVRTKLLEGWFIRLIWISLVQFGQFLICRGMMVHAWWWEQQLQLKKSKEDIQQRIDQQKKQAEMAKKCDEDAKAAEEAEKKKTDELRATKVEEVVPGLAKGEQEGFIPPEEVR